MARIQLTYKDCLAGDQHVLELDADAAVEAFNPLRNKAARAGDLQVGDRICINPGRLERGCEIVEITRV